MSHWGPHPALGVGQWEELVEWGPQPALAVAVGHELQRVQIPVDSRDPTTELEYRNWGPRPALLIGTSLTVGSELRRAQSQWKSLFDRGPQPELVLAPSETKATKQSVATNKT